MLELHLVFQLAVGIVFLLSSSGKLWNLGRFRQGLAAYRIVPPSLVNFTSLLVIALEGFLATAHLTGFLMEVTLVTGLIMLGGFGIAVVVNLKRGRALPCYCFGVSDSTISWATLIRLALLGLAESFLLRLYQPIYVLRITLPELAFAAFWAIFLLVVSFWSFGLGDILRLLTGDAIRKVLSVGPKNAQGVRNY